MAKRSKANGSGEKTGTAASARVLGVAKKGVKTSGDYLDYFSAMMSDIPEGKLSPQVANAMCNAGGKLAKMVEMQYKHGRSGKNGTPRQLALTA